MKNLWENKLKSVDKTERLEALKKLKQMIDQGEIHASARGEDVNNHIHTTYSFSPYTPSDAVYRAYLSGLSTAGIMDHDSISGAKEFIEAGKIIHFPVTVGAECRVSFLGTRLGGRRINNPDQESVAYVALHGVPYCRIEELEKFFKPYIEKRNIRNKNMVHLLNMLLDESLLLDFEKDVVPLSMLSVGGSITERHILYALSLKIIERLGKGKQIVDFLKDSFNIHLSDKIEGYLSDAKNLHYSYDLLGVLKGNLVGLFYIPATDECPHVTEIVKLSKKMGFILAYAYLGDVTDSVTGDKKAQTFEDSYLDLLVDEIAKLGFDAITYMPSRNTIEQLRRLKMLCEAHNMFEISGEDINSSRQSFLCEAMRLEEFKSLADSAWALIGHEKLAKDDISKSFVSEIIKKEMPHLKERIAYYASEGKKDFI